jgi:regulator of telomere elongation helicase 1
MSKKGAILFCVCRGTVSEGIDLVDELCRAVILVGVPYPNYKDPIVQEKMSYYDKLSKERKAKQQITLNGDGWYTLNTMRVVNQSIGRVIRHINDYGMIFLFDYRYDSQKLQSKLPLWAKESIAIYEDFSKVEKKVTAFY